MFRKLFRVLSMPFNILLSCLGMLFILIQMNTQYKEAFSAMSKVDFFATNPIVETEEIK